MGMIYRQSGRKVWMLKYYREGVPIVESSGTTVKTDAKTELQKREGAIANGQPLLPKIARHFRFEEAATDLENNYKIEGRRSLDELQRRIAKHLMPCFRGRRMSTITTSQVRAYIAKRQEDVIIVRKPRAEGEEPVTRPVSAGEINRELTALKRMFSLAQKDGKLLHRPHIPMLREDNVRVGFFEADAFEAVCRHLPAELQPMIRFAHLTGWRITSEVLPLEWRNVDFTSGEVRLDVGSTKNGDGRVFVMTAGLRTLLEAQRDERDQLKRKGLICPYVFFRMVAKGRRGPKAPRPIKAFTKAWAAACVAAGCPGRIPHDLRRTAVRNMVRAGIPERVAMKLTGHKTPSVFQRYNIVSDGDLASAARMLDRALLSTQANAR